MKKWERENIYFFEKITLYASAQNLTRQYIQINITLKNLQQNMNRRRLQNSTFQ